MHILRPAGLVKLSFGLKWVQKTKTSIYEISRILFLSMDFSFAYFANFNISSILKSPQNGQFHLQFSFGVYKRCSIQVGATSVSDVVRTSLYDVAKMLPQRRYNINQRLCRCFLIPDN